MAFTININESAYLPGEKIVGNFAWDFQGKPPKNLSLKLMWVTKSDGLNDEGMIEEFKVISQPSGTYEFMVKLPLFPWSYQGKKFSLSWIIVAQANNKEICRVEFISAPNKEPIKA